MRVTTTGSTTVITLNKKELIEVGREMVCTPGLKKKAETALDKLVIKVVKAADVANGGPVEW